MCGLTTQKVPVDNRVEVLLGIVEELRQEVKMVQVTVKELQGKTMSAPV